LSNLSCRLADVGRLEEALAPAQEAVREYRELAAANLGSFLLDLAGALSNLSSRLADLGRSEEALTLVADIMQILATSPEHGAED
jgi:hypothetical protein